MTKRVVPDAPGWWWASWEGVERPYRVVLGIDGLWGAVGGGRAFLSSDPGWDWLCPIPSPAELARLRVAERAARAASDVLEAHTAHADAVAAGDQDARDTAAHYHRLAMDEYREAVEAFRALDQTSEADHD